MVKDLGFRGKNWKFRGTPTSFAVLMRTQSEAKNLTFYGM